MVDESTLGSGGPDAIADGGLVAPREVPAAAPGALRLDGEDAGARRARPRRGRLRHYPRRRFIRKF